MITVLPLRHTYCFHGLMLDVRGDAVAAELLHERLCQFAPACRQDRRDLALEFFGIESSGQHPIEQPFGPARPVYDYVPASEVLYFESADQLYADHGGRVRMLAGLSDGTARASYLAADPMSAFIASHPFFTMLAMEFAKRRRRYPLHAGAVGLGGRALVFPGTSGAGKTTLVLALLRAGFDLVADDIVFFTAGEHGLEVLGFPDTAGVTSGTLTLFPEVQAHLSRSSGLRLKKQLVRLESVYGSNISARAQPSALVFPRVGGTDRSALASMGQDEAFSALLGQLRPTEVRCSQAHLDVLAQLATVCPCYRLETGRDLDALSGLLRPLLE